MTKSKSENEDSCRHRYEFSLQKIINEAIHFFVILAECFQNSIFNL